MSYYTSPNKDPEGPSTQYIRTLVPKTIKGMDFGTRILKYWVLGPSGGGSSVGQSQSGTLGWPPLPACAAQACDRAPPASTLAHRLAVMHIGCALAPRVLNRTVAFVSIGLSRLGHDQAHAAPHPASSVMADFQLLPCCEGHRVGRT